jgi:hypothetical protein
MDDTGGTPRDTTPQTGPALDRQAGGPPPEGIVENLAGAAPWARFMAILGFIGVGFMLLVGFGILVVGFPVEGEAGALRFLGLVYIVIAAVYLIPVLPLNRFAAAAGRLRREPSYEVAAEALRHNRVFWKRLGILSIIGAVLTVLMLFVAVFLGLLASLMNR